MERYDAWQRVLQLVSSEQQVIAARSNIDAVAVNEAIGHCKRGGHWQMALALLRNMEDWSLERDVVGYSAAISASESASQWWRALTLFDQMAESIAPNVVTYSAVICACGKASWWSSALHFLSEMEAWHVLPNLFTFNSAITACANGFQWAQSLALMAELRRTLQPDTITFNALMVAFQKAGLWEEAIRLLDELIEEALLPSIISFNSAINACGCGNIGNWPLSLAFFDTMQQIGLQPSMATFGALIGQEGFKWGSVSQLLRVMTANHLRLNQISASTAITSYADTNWTSSMHLLGMSRRAGAECGTFLWNGAIAACGDRWTAGIGLLQELGERRIADVVSFNAAMERCNEEWKITCQLYVDIDSRGLRSTEISQNSLLRSYGKGTQWEKAFRTSGRRVTSISSNAAVSACEKCSFWDIGLSSLAGSASMQVEPDIIGFATLVSACEKANRWLQACTLLQDTKASDILANVIFCNAATSACVANVWPRALSTFGVMRNRFLQVDLVSHSGAISAAEKAGWWELPYRILAEMETTQVQADEICFGAAVSACETAQRQQSTALS